MDFTRRISDLVESKVIRILDRISPATSRMPYVRSLSSSVAYSIIAFRNIGPLNCSKELASLKNKA